MARHIKSQISPKETMRTMTIKTKTDDSNLSSKGSKRRYDNVKGLRLDMSRRRRNPRYKGLNPNALTTRAEQCASVNELADLVKKNYLLVVLPKIAPEDRDEWKTDFDTNFARLWRTPDSGNEKIVACGLPIYAAMSKTPERWQLLDRHDDNLCRFLEDQRSDVEKIDAQSRRILMQLLHALHRRVRETILEPERKRKAASFERLRRAAHLLSPPKTSADEIFDLSGGAYDHVDRMSSRLDELKARSPRRVEKYRVRIASSDRSAPSKTVSPSSTDVQLVERRDELVATRRVLALSPDFSSLFMTRTDVRNALDRYDAILDLIFETYAVVDDDTYLRSTEWKGMCNDLLSSHDDDGLMSKCFERAATTSSTSRLTFSNFLEAITRVAALDATTDDDVVSHLGSMIRSMSEALRNQHRARIADMRKGGREA